MPTVPRYKRQVQAAATPRVRVQTSAPEGAFGGGVDTEAVSRAFGKATQAVTNVYLEEQQRADEVNVVGAKKHLTNLEVDLQYNKEYGYKHRRGKDAGEAIADINERWEKGTAEILNGLTNERQKFVFQREAERRRDSVFKNLQGHAFVESRKHDDAETGAFIENEQNAAIASYQDPGRVRDSIENVRQEIYSYGQRNGLSAEVVKQRMDVETSKTHYMVANQYLNANQDMVAKEYFKKHKDQIVGKDRINLEKALEVGSVRGDSQREADKIMAKGMSLTESLSKAREIKDPEKRDETVRRVKTMHQEKKVIREQMEGELFLKSYNDVEKSRNLDAISPESWALLDPQSRTTLKKLAAGDDIKTDWGKYYDLKQMAAAPKTRDKFMRMDLSKARNYLSDSEFKEMTTTQANLRKKDANAIAKLDGFMSDRQVVHSTLEAAGFDTKPKTAGSDEAKKYNEVMRHIDNQVARWKEANNAKVIPNKELQSIVDNLVVEGVVPGSGVPLFGPFGGPRVFETKKKVFELDPGEAFDFEVDSIPQAEQQKIRDTLRRHNIPINNDTIKKLYFDTKLKGI